MAQLLEQHADAPELCRRAHQLAEIAARERHEDRRRHMLDLAATYRRTADRCRPPCNLIWSQIFRDTEYKKPRPLE